MSDPAPNGLTQSRWPKRIGRLIDAICLVALIAVFMTVIYGFWLRAMWAHGYYLAVAVAILGAFVILIGLAQQAIAARDVATWRDMAEWQIRAARAAAGKSDDEIEPHSAAYYEVLIGTLVAHAEQDEQDIAREHYP
ncbi:hypothetical protein [Sphingomonas faeni]|uniref:hypothetical protein n=1 Tax=Sphingomonas faeni TaxID=185950 RepID=UPI0020C7FC5C|nr:hypothetical protein [Sphingomonas faeni]MCP8889319.1 hypothetical protein [Sphingomonas faeni]